MSPKKVAMLARCEDF